MTSGPEQLPDVGKPDQELPGVDPHATTAHGLPYPAATDPVAQGATAIQALANAVDAKLGWYLIAERKLLAPANPVTFAAIPTIFRALRIVFGNVKQTTSGLTNGQLRCNGDAGGSAYIDSQGGGYKNAYVYAASIPGTAMPATYGAGGYIEIPYPNGASVQYATRMIHSVYAARVAGAGQQADLAAAFTAGLWIGGAPSDITQLDLAIGTGQYAIGSYFGLYGLV